MTGTVVLLAPTMAKTPVYHRTVYLNPMPDGLRDRLKVPEGWRAFANNTGCGIVLRAWFWDPTVPYPGDNGYTETGTGSSEVHLRTDHAAAFGRPCRRCWPHGPT